METVINKMSMEQQIGMAGLALANWDRLSFRHHGLGMLQAYIMEGEERELRLHIWHPDLVIEEAVWSGSFHDHRFDMTSFVLVGNVPHREVTLKDGDDMQVWSVVNARNVDKTQAPFTAQQLTGYDIEDMTIHEGRQYHFPKRVFHQSDPVTELAVTVILKDRQVDEYARILVPRGVEPTHMTRGRDLSMPAVQAIKNQAWSRLRDIWHHA